MDIKKLLKSELENQPKGMLELATHLDSGLFDIGEIRMTNRDENTRFVIIEKYPEKDNYNWEPVAMEGLGTSLYSEVSKTTMYLHIELIPKESKYEQ